MQDVTAVICTQDRLVLHLVPDSDPDLLSRDFPLGSVVAGGSEWGCFSQSNLKATPFFRKVVDILSINRNKTSPQVVLATSDCQIFDAFEKQDIEIWSETSWDLRAKKRTPNSSAPSTRINIVDEDEKPESVSEKFADVIVLKETHETKISLGYDVDAQFSFRFKIRAGFESLKPKLYEFESWIDESIKFSYKAEAEVKDEYSINFREGLLP